MAAWTLEQAQTHLATWLTASEAVAQGQEHEIQSGNTRRKLTRANLFQINRMIQFWRKEVEQLQRSETPGPKIRYIEPE